MMEEKGKKLPQLLYIGHTIFLLLFLGLWLLSTETHFVPLLLLILGLVVSLVGYFLTFFLVKMIEARDPRSHFFIVMNIVILTLSLLIVVVSGILYYEDSLQTDLGEAHNAQIDAFVIAGDVLSCSNYLVQNELADVTEAQTTCNLRIAIARQDKSLCENIPDPDKKEICFNAFE